LLPSSAVEAEVFVVSSPAAADALADADAFADGDAESEGFGVALADALGVAEADALGLVVGLVVGFGLGAGAGGAVYGVTPGYERVLEVWNLNATQPPVGMLRLYAPELAYVHPPPLPFAQNNAQ